MRGLAFFCIRSRALDVTFGAAIFCALLLRRMRATCAGGLALAKLLDSEQRATGVLNDLESELDFFMRKIAQEYETTLARCKCEFLSVVEASKMSANELAAAHAELRKAQQHSAGQAAQAARKDERLAELCRALAHPHRVFILRFLLNQRACFAGEIAEQLPVAASTVSQHLTQLKDAGLIKGEVDGPRRCYSVAPEALAQLQQLVGAL